MMRMLKIFVLFISVVPVAWVSADLPCDENEDFRVRFGGQTHFVVTANGTCACPNGGFVGDGRRLSDLNQNPEVATLLSQVSSLEDVVSRQQATISTLRGILETTDDLSASLEASAGNASCAAIRRANPAAPSGSYSLLDRSGNLRQWYCDMTTDGGGWTMVWKAPAANLDSPNLSYFPGARVIVADSAEMLFAFADQNNALSQAWKFPIPPGFVSKSPMEIDWCNYNVINATRVADGLSVTRVLRAGFSTFGATCDDGCFSPGLRHNRTHPYFAQEGGYWGQICLKNTSRIPEPYPLQVRGFEDFPHYAGFAVSASDHCADSSAVYTTVACSADRLFTILVR